MNETVLEGILLDDDVYDFDITGDLDVADTIKFYAATRKADLTDADALVTKSRGAGITDVDAPTGKFQVRITPADKAAVVDEALVFKCVVHKADTGTDTTVAEGIIRY